MDREKIIRQIAAAMATLEKCSEQDIESTKRFLRWMSDDALTDMWEKHKKALEQRTPAAVKR
jgi:hypothetical protein